jgi:hypothetical protein
MYVIIHKNRVILGILPWNSQYYTDVLRSRYRITTELPRNEPAPDVFPWEIDADTKIVPAEEVRPNIENPLVKYYYGPTWDFLETKVIANYEVIPHAIEDARANYKVKAGTQRYEQEVSGTSITINDVEYKIETDRSSRTKYIEKYVSMGETVNWKFNEGWVVLTKTQMQSIVAAIDTHVQSAYDEELRLNAVIDACETAEQLEAVEELNKKPNDEILGQMEQPQE